MSGGTGEPAVEIRQDAAAGRFHVVVDGVVAGFADYRDADGVREFPHTVVEPEYGGRGLAGRLVGTALDATRDEGLRIRPTCSYVAAYVDKHPEYADLVA